MDTLTLLLPVLWAIVATGIGLVLYKTSEALFESNKRNKTGTRRIRLVGSVTIAALAFYGMKVATPSQRLEGIPPGMTIVNSKDLNTLYDLSTQLDRSSLELQGCLSTLELEDCKEKVQSIRKDTLSVTTIISRILQDDKVKQSKQGK